jgi:TonB family protein
LFKDFEVLYGPSRSISSTDLEDQSDYIKSYSYILKARSAGTRVIESASFTYDNEVYTTKPRVITIIDEASQEQDLDISVKKSDPEDKIEGTDRSVSFETIEMVPIFPGCEGASDSKVCFQEEMQKHIRKHFRYPEIAYERGIQGRVDVMFVIQADGSIGGIRMRGPDKILEAEALRIINLLPNMTPGRQRGRAVKVPFSTSITFRLE